MLGAADETALGAIPCATLRSFEVASYRNKSTRGDVHRQGDPLGEVGYAGKIGNLAFNASIYFGTLFDGFV